MFKVVSNWLYMELTKMLIRILLAVWPVTVNMNRFFISAQNVVALCIFNNIVITNCIFILDIISRSESGLKEAFQELELSAKAMGLGINQRKSKYMVVGPNNSALSLRIND